MLAWASTWCSPAPLAAAPSSPAPHHAGAAPPCWQLRPPSQPTAPHHTPLPPLPAPAAEDEEEGEGAGVFFDEDEVLAGAAAASLGMGDVEEVRSASDVFDSPVRMCSVLQCGCVQLFSYGRLLGRGMT